MKRTGTSTSPSHGFAAASTLFFLGFSALAASPADSQKAASAEVGFAFNLLKEFVKEQPAANIFISPYSAATVLQMAANGAVGQTKLEMQQALGTTSLAPEALNEAYSNFGKSLNARDTNVILTTANAIWYQKGIVVKPGFISCNQQFFGATVDPLDFNDGRSTDVINAWASEKTRGKINRVGDGLINPLMRLVLANAVYFKGKWEVPFDVKSTKERPFHLRGGRQMKTPMMEQTRRFTYRRGTGYQAVRLPYQGWSLAMYLFLPDTGSAPEKLLGIMNSDSWQRVTEPGFSEREGTVALPRFRLQYSAELERPLKALGMRTPFGKADFSGVSSEPLFISAVRQATFVEVNEEGTEAVAATDMVIASGIEMNPPKPFQMIVDRPFLFLIADQETKTILFMGVVFDPAQAS